MGDTKMDKTCMKLMAQMPTKNFTQKEIEEWCELMVQDWLQKEIFRIQVDATNKRKTIVHGQLLRRTVKIE